MLFRPGVTEALWLYYMKRLGSGPGCELVLKWHTSFASDTIPLLITAYICFFFLGTALNESRNTHSVYSIKNNSPVVVSRMYEFSRCEVSEGRVLN